MTCTRFVSRTFQVWRFHELTAIGALLFMCGALLGQSMETKSPISPSAENVALGKALYERSCVYCHGLDGDGNGPVTPYLDLRPRDFTTGVYKFRSTASGQIPTDWDLMQSVTAGIHGTSMVGWEALDEIKRWQLIDYIKTFSGRFAESEDFEIIAVGSPPGATQESVKRGKQLFTDYGCWQCHGHGGKSDGPSSKLLIDDFGYAIIPRDLTKGDNFGLGHSPREIYQTLATGINGTPMPSYLGAFEGKEDELWDLANYVSFLAGGE